MFLKQIDLTTALRPSYLPDEVLLFVQDNVGLYEGKYKLPNQQNGQVYLTSHRICYVDKENPRKYSAALDLKDVERYEFYGGFMKSSAKVTVFPKPSKRSSLQPRSPAPAGAPGRNGTASPLQRSESPLRAIDDTPKSVATWVCPICSFSNPVPSNFDPATANADTPLPPCLACGIKPSLTHVLKAAIANASKRAPVAASPAPTGMAQPSRPTPLSEVSDNSLAELSAQAAGTFSASPSSRSAAQSTDLETTFQCPRCTFDNHPSLLACEMCGAPLISRDVPSELRQSYARTESPGPVLNASIGNLPPGLEGADSIKISFRGGGEKIFYERLKGSMTQRKWLLQGAPPIPKPTHRSSPSNGGASGAAGPGGGGVPERVKVVGIAGLEQRGLDLRKNNELVIGSAFEDLEALMASAKEIIELAERFSRQVKGSAGSNASDNALLAESASQLGLITTKDIVGGSGDDSLYLSELSRNLAEYLTDDARGVLRKAGGIISLVDLWAMFNRARGGVELVSPHDFEKAARLWEKLKLPVRLRTFKSGVLVVQGSDRTDETTVRALLAWLRDLHEFPPDNEVPWNWQTFGRGVTALDAAERFGWSIGVAEEELEMAEERGVLCREEGIEGLKFWENFIDTGEGRTRRDEAKEAEERIVKALRNSGFL